ncbi:amino acid permease-domain-containing protein [Hypoxylon sp. FL1284]|nr:amino acid permease-domain-containing protein [Hypoxylon sp. FL1284]
MATDENRSYQLRSLSRNTEPSLGYGSAEDPKVLPALTNSLSHEDGHTYDAPSHIQVRPQKRRITNRKLLPIHAFMITINATLGVGLYWRGGQILELGGPLAIIISFLLLGMLAWAVTQCITELLCIWPVPGALAVFVREFVDFELGIVVGIAYWFTYSISFATLIATSASEAHYFNVNLGVDAGVLYLLVPLVLIIINSFGIEKYGWFEVATGVLKLGFLVIITVTMIVLAAQTDAPGWSNPRSYDEDAAQNWVVALFMCLSTATFAYVGVEVPAALALEARPTKPQRTSPGQVRRRNEASSIGETVRFTSKWVSVFACAAYTICGILVSLTIGRGDPKLPRLDWLPNDSDKGAESAFTAVAELYGNFKIARTFNFFQVFTALSAANASRTLFGLTNQIDGDPDEPWYLNVLAWIGRTNSYRVPIRAMTVSALAFIWLPFLQLQGDSSTPNQGITIFISTLAEMGSVGVLIVWACECWAFIRYYHCINKHQSELMERRVPRVRRFSDEDDNDYPYISNGQPVTAYLGLAACLVILVVINGASMWKEFHYAPLLSSYLIVFIFVGLWVVLKLWRGARWSLVDLSNPDRAIDIIRGLHDFSFAGFQYDPREAAAAAADGGSSSWWSSPWPLSALGRKPSAERGRRD